jgi:hypothetical protein
VGTVERRVEIVEARTGEHAVTMEALRQSIDRLDQRVTGLEQRMAGLEVLSASMALH